MKEIDSIWMVSISVIVFLFAVIAILKFANVNIDRMIFKSSITYSEGTTEFLAKSFREFSVSENIDEKRAIMEYVVMRYPNLSTKNIENEKLKTFYEMCLTNKQ